MTQLLSITIRRRWIVRSWAAYLPFRTSGGLAKRGSPLYYGKISPNYRLSGEYSENYFIFLLERGPTVVK